VENLLALATIHTELDQTHWDRLLKQNNFGLQAQKLLKPLWSKISLLLAEANLLSTAKAV
jgi:hypothetical protein